MRADVLDPKHLDQELRKFVDPRTNRLGACRELRMAGEQMRIEISDHAGAGARGDYDRHTRLARFQEATRERERLIAKSLVERRLSATEGATNRTHPDAQ